VFQGTGFDYTGEGRERASVASGNRTDKKGVDVTGADWLVRVDFESVEDFFIPFLLWSFRLKK
jgi:hypothetical protein